MPDTVSDRIDRHLQGERVTTEYINLKTGESVYVPPDEPVPAGCIPMMGTVNGGEKPLSEEDAS